MSWLTCGIITSQWHPFKRYLGQLKAWTSSDLYNYKFSQSLVGPNCTFLIFPPAMQQCRETQSAALRAQAVSDLSTQRGEKVLCCSLTSAMEPVQQCNYCTSRLVMTANNSYESLWMKSNTARNACVGSVQNHHFQEVSSPKININPQRFMSHIFLIEHLELSRPHSLNKTYEISN